MIAAYAPHPETARGLPLVCLGNGARLCMLRPDLTNSRQQETGFLNRRIQINDDVSLPGLCSRRLAPRRTQEVAGHPFSARARRARRRGHVADPDRLARGDSRSPGALALHRRDAAMCPLAATGPTRTCLPWRWPSLTRRRPSFTATRRAPISPDSRWVDTARGSWRGNIQRVGCDCHCGWWNLLELCARALAPGLDVARRICAGGGPHADLALSWRRRQHRGAAAGRVALRSFEDAGGHVRLWVYQGLKHDCWTRAFNEPNCPAGCLMNTAMQRRSRLRLPSAFPSRCIPPALKLTPAQLDSFAGDYVDKRGPGCSHALSPGGPALPEESLRRNCGVGGGVQFDSFLPKWKQPYADNG